MKKYSIKTNKFNDSYIINWLIWENPKNAILSDKITSKKISYKYRSARVFSRKKHNKFVTIKIPVSRYGDIYVDKIIHSSTTIHTLMKYLYNFYQQFITQNEFDKLFDGLPTDIDDYYIINARQMLMENKLVTYLDLIGTKCFGPLLSIIKNDRNILNCIGLVRFEGLIEISKNNYLIALGN